MIRKIIKDRVLVIEKRRDVLLELVNNHNLFIKEKKNYFPFPINDTEIVP